MEYLAEKLKFVQSLLFTNNDTTTVFEKPSAYKNINTSSTLANK
jgi:hypothetical protein